jgi:hypothetical protein
MMEFGQNIHLPDPCFGFQMDWSSVDVEEKVSKPLPMWKALRRLMTEVDNRIDRLPSAEQEFKDACAAFNDKEYDSRLATLYSNAAKILTPEQRTLLNRKQTLTIDEQATMTAYNTFATAIHQLVIHRQSETEDLEQLQLNIDRTKAIQTDVTHGSYLAAIFRLLNYTGTQPHLMIDLYRSTPLLVVIVLHQGDHPARVAAVVHSDGQVEPLTPPEHRDDSPYLGITNYISSQVLNRDMSLLFLDQVPVKVTRVIPDPFTQDPKLNQNTNTFDVRTPLQSQLSHLIHPTPSKRSQMDENEDQSDGHPWTTMTFTVPQQCSMRQLAVQVLAESLRRLKPK